jgi:hypothetical protein
MTRRRGRAPKGQRVHDDTPLCDEEALLRAIGSALAQVSAQDAKGWFASCGYSII